MNQTIEAFLNYFSGQITTRLVWTTAVAGLTILSQPCQAQLVSSKGVGQVEAFVTTYCVHCHGRSQNKAGLRLDDIDWNEGPEPDLLRKVLTKIDENGMPPPDVTQRPSSAETEVVTRWLDQQIKSIQNTTLAGQGSVSFKRLSRQEFAYTVNDLLGVNFHVDDAGGLNDDDVYDGFSRIGPALTFSASHLEKYLAAAEAVVEEAYPDVAPLTARWKYKAIQLAGGPNVFGEKQFAELSLAPPNKFLRLDLWPGQLVRVAPPGLQSAGTYRFRIQLSGCKSNDDMLPHFAIYDQELDRLLFENDVGSTEKQPVELNFEVHLPFGNHEFVMTNEVVGPLILQRLGRTSHPFYSLKEGYLPWQLALTDDDGLPMHPCLIIDHVTIEGPLISKTVEEKRTRFWPVDENDPDQVRTALTEFAEKAFRRPVSDTVIDRLMRLVSNQISLGDSPRQAFKTTILSILVSKDFLYLVEGTPNCNSTALTHFELASRLSYFLWSSMPDDELLELARENRLGQQQVLAAQFERMIADPRAQRFVDDFAHQWLSLGRVGRFKPNSKLYPDYDKYLERSMVQETEMFFGSVLSENLSLREFLCSDWTFLNSRLARHYEIDLPATPDGSQFCKVDVQGNDHRGGLLTQASILSLTSDGTRHRPVHRGLWVFDAIFGQRVPPPPANIKPLEQDPQHGAPTTVRDKIEAYVANPDCMMCHDKIDPLGFAFENYDAIGRWRSQEVVPTVQGVYRHVDASGKLPDGRSFSGVNEFEQLLLEDIDNFNLAFTKKLAIYALRRPLTSNDKHELDGITAISQSNDYRLQDLIKAIVLSDLFRSR